MILLFWVCASKMCHEQQSQNEKIYLFEQGKSLDGAIRLEDGVFETCSKTIIIFANVL